MKKLIILSLLALSFSGCKNNTQKEQNTSNENETETTEKPSSPLETGCYSYNANNNIINFEITSLENGVTANLNYALDEKDSNSGTFNGKLNDDKLIGEYTFMSEGVESKREIAFLIKENQLIEGHGTLNENGTAFTDKSNINYNSTMPLVKTDCETLMGFCLFVNGNVYSNLQHTCLELTTLNTKLNPLKDGAKVDGNSAFLIFDETNSKAELFLPNANEGLIMHKSNEGDWSNDAYKLIAWKGYVVQLNGIAIYGGE